MKDNQDSHKMKPYYSKLLLLVFLLLILYGMNEYRAPNMGAVHHIPATIILSPHFDDAVLSLGGFIAKKEGNVTVATFFTGGPQKSITTIWDTYSGFNDSNEAIINRIEENHRALQSYGVKIRDYDYLDFEYRDNVGRTKESDHHIQFLIENDIIKLINDNLDSDKDSVVNVYGPAYFGETITHPDHKILHQALIDLAKSYQLANVHYFIYEDFPYIQNFNRAQTLSLSEFLTNNYPEFSFDEEVIPLDQNQLKLKLKSISAYVSQVKAFNFLHEDILKEEKKYDMTRCPGYIDSFGCEGVFEITNNQ
jgi:LmbE family N-acetylglucosaminyl deacetylase